MWLLHGLIDEAVIAMILFGQLRTEARRLFLIHFHYAKIDNVPPYHYHMSAFQTHLNVPFKYRVWELKCRMKHWSMPPYITHVYEQPITIFLCMLVSRLKTASLHLFQQIVA